MKLARRGGRSRPRRAAHSRFVQARRVTIRRRVVRASSGPRESHIKPLRARKREHVLARCARADERHRRPRARLDEGDVVARCRRELVADRLPPAGSVSKTGRQWWKSLWCAGNSTVSVPSRQPISDANGQLRELREHVELRQRELRDPVDAHREPQCDEVEPTASPLPPGHGPELAAELAHALVRQAPRSRSGTGPRRRASRMPSRRRRPRRCGSGRCRS